MGLGGAFAAVADDATTVKQALTFALEIADKSLAAALKENAALARGLNIYNGQVMNEEVARSQGRQIPAKD